MSLSKALAKVTSPTVMIVYPSLSALTPVDKLLEEAGKAISPSQ